MELIILAVLLVILAVFVVSLCLAAACPYCRQVREARRDEDMDGFTSTANPNYSEVQ